ncbi:MAG: hypothetical protein AAF937_03410 [Planctomycetota bacterium]
METEHFAKPGGLASSWVVRGFGLAIGILFLSVWPFQKVGVWVDLANGVIEHRSRSWWGLIPSTSVKQTWVGDHHSAGAAEPVWRQMWTSMGGSLLSRGWIGSSRFKFASFDDKELRDADRTGVITQEMKGTVADAVRRQWLRMADDGEDPRSSNWETIAQQLVYWEFECRVLTADELLQLEQGTPWNEVLYPE